MGLTPAQTLDDAQARYDGAIHKVTALQKAYELVKLGPRQEEIDSLRGQVQQAKGALAFAETNLANTVILAPVTGTILERAVEKGEFVTTSFVGDRGAKGYVVSLADLNDLERHCAPRYRTSRHTRGSRRPPCCARTRCAFVAQRHPIGNSTCHRTPKLPNPNKTTPPTWPWGGRSSTPRQRQLFLE